MEENQALRAEANLEHNMVAVSARMKDVFEFVRRVAATDATLLIEGQSWTGKELVAPAVHRNSARAENPFVAINCAAITENLPESELFGHEKGAFTGSAGKKKEESKWRKAERCFWTRSASSRRNCRPSCCGYCKSRNSKGGRNASHSAGHTADCGDEQEIVGSDRTRRISEGVVLPAERSDTPRFAEHFLSKASRKCKTRIKELSEEAKACLVKYDWPGNVRELENAIERAVVLVSGNVVLPEDLPETALEAGWTSADEPAKYHRSVKETKGRMIVQALQQAHGSYLEAAKMPPLTKPSRRRRFRPIPRTIGRTRL